MFSDTLLEVFLAQVFPSLYNNMRVDFFLYGFRLCTDALYLCSRLIILFRLIYGRVIKKNTQRRDLYQITVALSLFLSTRFFILTKESQDYCSEISITLA